MKYGGKLDRNIIKIARNWEKENKKKFFPNQPDSALDDYFSLMDKSQQFRQLHNTYGNLIAYADYWLIDKLIEQVENKFWSPLWPNSIENGNILYSNWAWTYPDYRNLGIMSMFLNDLRHDFQNKTICFHRLKKNKSIFLKFQPMVNVCTI